MILPLTEEYLPKHILHRDKQLLEIENTFKNFRKMGAGQSIAIIGVTGSGKTTIIRKIIDKENNSIYINCNETKTTFRTIKKISNAKVQTESEVLMKSIDYLKENPRIIILDEIDKIKNLTSLMNDINTIYRKTMVPIIIITPKRNIVECMPSDVRKTLFFNKLTLPSYNANELLDILNDRLKSIDIRFDGLDEATRNFICGVAAKQGSARVLINIIIRCIQINNFSQNFIMKVYKDMMREDWLGFFSELNDSEKKFLKLLLEHCDWEKEVASEQLQKDMKLTPSRISQLINVFERYSVVTSRHNNKGRGGGRVRMVKFTNKETFKEIDKECP